MNTAGVMGGSGSPLQPRYLENIGSVIHHMCCLRTRRGFSPLLSTQTHFKPWKRIHKDTTVCSFEVLFYIQRDKAKTFLLKRIHKQWIIGKSSTRIVRLSEKAEVIWEGHNIPGAVSQVSRERTMALHLGYVEGISFHTGGDYIFVPVQSGLPVLVMSSFWSHS